jgi:signal transduction histidine kinase
VGGRRTRLLQAAPRGCGGALGRPVVTVGDSRPGIVSEDSERIFESFYTTKSGGVGIGLSICHSIIETHAGRLFVDAHQPRGGPF